MKPEEEKKIEFIKPPESKPDSGHTFSKDLGLGDPPGTAQPGIAVRPQTPPPVVPQNTSEPAPAPPPPAAGGETE